MTDQIPVGLVREAACVGFLRAVVRLVGPDDPDNPLTAPH